MSNLARRFLTAIGLVAVLILYTAVPAMAKMTPFFTVAVVPSEPVAGQPMVVIVRTWEDAVHRVPARFDSASALDGLLVLRSATGGSADIAIPLRFQATDEFRGTVAAPAAGEWILVAFPDRTGWGSPEVSPGYPDTIAVTVLPESGDAVSVWVVAGLAAAIIAAAGARAIGQRPRTGWSGSAVRWRRRPTRSPEAPARTAR